MSDFPTIDRALRHLDLDPHDQRFVQDPYAAYARLHETGPLVYWRQYGMWCAASHDGVNALLRDKRFGRERPGGYPGPAAAGRDRAHLARFDRAEARSLLELEPPAHTRLRRLVNRAFVSRQVERLRPMIEALCHRLIDGFEAAGSVDLLPHYATPVPAAIIAHMMGVPVEDGPRLVAWSNDMVRMYMHEPHRSDEERADAAAGAFADFILQHAAARRDRPGDDLLSVLVTARDGDEALSDDEIVSSAILLLNAGHEATVHQIGNAVATILAQGNAGSVLFADDDAAAATIEECLRFDPPLHMFTRYAYERVELEAGVVIAPGEQVALLLGAANRDPAAYDAPHRFMPGRADQKSVSFGAGIHFCIGAPLARLEMQIALKVLFQRLPRLRLAERPAYRDIYHFHGLESLELRW